MLKRREYKAVIVDLEDNMTQNELLMKTLSKIEKNYNFNGYDYFIANNTLRVVVYEPKERN
jgi:hypothetical protein